MSNVIKFVPQDKNMRKNWLFCTNCGFAIDKLQVELARVDLSCARCGQVKISHFCSYGSHYYKKLEQAGKV